MRKRVQIEALFKEAPETLLLIDGCAKITSTLKKVWFRS